MRPNKEIVIGYAPRDLEVIADPLVSRVFADTYSVYREMGFAMKEVALPEMPYSAATSTIIACEASSIFEELIVSGRVDQLADQNQISGVEGFFRLHGAGLSEGHAYKASGAGDVREVIRRRGCVIGAEPN